MPRAIRQAVAAGVKCIEHGHLIDEPSAKLLADEGIWWSLQPFLDDEDVPAMSPESHKKALQVFAGTDNAYKLAKKYNIKTAFGTDILFDARIASRQERYLPRWSAGTRRAKLSKWRPQTTASWWRFPGLSILIPENLASSKKARSQTCC